MEGGAESFGTLRLVHGGKHGYVGVRGRQGKKRNKYQAYVAVDGKKKTVSGLYKSAHAAAVALAQWKQNRELGLEDEPDEKQPRKKRGTKAAEQLATAAGTSASSWQLQRVPLEPLKAYRPAFSGLAPWLSTSAAFPLPNNVSAAAFGVPVVHAWPLYRP